MNIDRIEELADFLDELPPERFNMKTWMYGFEPEIEPTSNDCKTVGCIAGWTVAYFNEAEAPDGDYYQEAMELLGLDEMEADSLFVPGIESSYQWMLPSDAADVLRAMVEGKDPAEEWAVKAYSEEASRRVNAEEGLEE